ncbi:ABC transporter ATP-binding protein [Xinfangfangia sp. CPCC 101601]|uniref:ABC transporter ATP-binding protein n=1 Tax=Pseudogemmobacter lacusdianii TaxID=3069608 RepID=A0ABU0VXW3_9RHOB|nr:ABC transporter ATP-binding protein [Xinfangfangia sp. CPCC 101601]MDQ2066572.1 ABC transporter ATP-binding protein [Xinfangfangia sp. CPCC 101601]
MSANDKTAGAAVPALPQSVLSVQGLTVSVPGQDLVKALSFDLAKGETLAIAGESGSGKSITSLTVMGLLPPQVQVTSGAVQLEGRDLLTLPEAQMRQIRGGRIAMIFQEPMTSLNPVMTIGAQLIEAITAHEALPRAEARARALEALTAVRISQPERRLRQYPHELSGGMRQRVMIAMALALKPDVLICDEPTTALDVTVQREVLDLLHDLQRQMGTALILITHDMGVVAEMADRVIILRHGQMVEEGAVAQIFHAPQAQYTKDLLAAVPKMGKGEGAELQISVEPPIARLTDVQVRFDLRGGLLQRVTHRVHAVEGVSFDIRAGETFALVGESGCGKSTIAKALVGLVPHQGRIEVGGQALNALSTAERRRLTRDLQMVFQDPMAALDPRMTVGDLVAEPLLIHGLGTPQERAARVAELFAQVGLPPEAMQRYPHEFSGGQRQRICIARALALRPKLIICDESVSALDVSVQARVLALLGDLKRDLGLSFLFISHDMAVVENICDRVAVMYLGQIVETGSRAQVFGNPQHPYTRRLMEAVPVPDPAHRRPPLPRLTGEVPSPIHPVGQGPQRVLLEDIGGGHLVARADAQSQAAA